MTLLHPKVEPTQVNEPDAEALIREARQFRRLRWLRGGLVVLLVVFGTSLGVLLTQHQRPSGTSMTSPGRSLPTTNATYVSPESPQDMAVAPNGGLYVVDSGRDQILRWVPSHGFVVVAGTGRRGYSGDGGPAGDAEIHLEYDAGIAVGHNGTVYFSDSWNARVRAILPNGRIETVAGGGAVPLADRPVPAQRARLGGGPAGLTIGPGGDLYLGLQSGVYRLDGQGNLDWVVGKTIRPGQVPENGGVYANPANQNDFQPAVWLAFDRSGDLYVAGGGGWGLYEKSTAGQLRFVGNDREPGGFWGSLTNLPNGTVGAIDESPGMASFLSAHEQDDLGKALGKLPHPLPTGSDDRVFAPDFVAYAANGNLYVDDIAGAALPTLSAIAMVKPDGAVTLLWKGNQ